MKKPSQKTMNVVYAFLIFTPVMVQAGNMWTTNGLETTTSYNATRTPSMQDSVDSRPDQITSPTTSQMYNSDPSLRSQNIYSSPAPTDSATDYDLDSAPDMDR